MIDNIYDIKESIHQLVNKFNNISKLGWINKKTSNEGEAGNNIEVLLGKENNDFQIPDFDGIEIKTKQENAFNSYITLFNCIPYGKDFFEIKRIKEKYGYPDSTLKEYKVFNGEVFCNFKKKIGAKFFFELKVNRELKRINLLIFDIYGNLIDCSTYWPFDILEQKLYCKLKYLALIKVSNKFYNGKRYYKYNSLEIFKLKDFEQFLNLIEQRHIKILFRIGIFKTGKRIGKIHDRGTSFQINTDYINLLYDEIYPNNIIT